MKINKCVPCTEYPVIGDLYVKDMDDQGVRDETVPYIMNPGMSWKEMRILDAGEQFKHISATNFIHSFLLIESATSSIEEITATYKFINRLIGECKHLCLELFEVPVKLALINKTIEKLGIKRKITDNLLISESISRGVADCDILSLVHAAVAHEFNIKVNPVIFLGHMSLELEKDWFYDPMWNKTVTKDKYKREFGNMYFKSRPLARCDLLAHAWYLVSTRQRTTKGEDYASTLFLATKTNVNFYQAMYKEFTSMNKEN